MVRKYLSVILIAALSLVSAPAQTRTPKLPPVGDDKSLSDMSQKDKGFWCAGQLSGGYSTLLSSTNVPFTELDFVGGYRFSQYLKVGIGLGGRYYFNNNDLRKTNTKLSMPIFVNVRGNFYDDTYHTVTPYYSMDLGETIGDGFMMRPTIGIRVGQSRSAFIAGVTYTGQVLRKWNDKRRFVSLMGITLGYEF